MKTVKAIVLTLILGLAGIVYASADTTSTSQCKMGQGSANCCLTTTAKASCCKEGSACKTDRSCCTEGSGCCASDCCNAGASCCAADGSGCNAEVGCCSGHSCCAAKSSTE